ncbi:MULTISPECIES: hypothetical protein [Metabacillus]|uniref:hypothetical protein n=1 Tax=Metabacillus TaxID=2675233 RepID=UPI000493A345|nr:MULTISPECIES: hypothetical protein [Metabacillus]KEZ50410.1 hypothetical protein AZ46_0206910 [Metabacillus indicus LMG 22858]
MAERKENWKRYGGYCRITDYFFALSRILGLHSHEESLLIFVFHYYFKFSYDTPLIKQPGSVKMEMEAF